MPKRAEASAAALVPVEIVPSPGVISVACGAGVMAFSIHGFGLVFLVSHRHGVSEQKVFRPTEIPSKPSRIIGIEGIVHRLRDGSRGYCAVVRLQDSLMIDKGIITVHKF